MTGRTAPRVAAIVLALLAVGPLLALAQGVARISDLTVLGLTPLTVSFRFHNDGDRPLPSLVGAATLSELQVGDIERFAVQTPPIPAGGSAHVEAASRWEFQLAGMYVIEVALDLGSGSLVSTSLRFRIAPIALPRAPVAGEEGLLTLFQQPANWGVDRIGARDAWAITHGSPDIVVAVIDSGIDWTVPQLAGSQWVNVDEIPGNGIDDDGNGYIDDVHGWDFRDNDAGSHIGTSIHGHGTVVASILAARPGRYPVVGIAPGVKLMDVRFLDSSNSFRSSDWGAFSRAIAYAVNNGAHIINLSIYANGRPPASFEQAVNDARARGVVVVGIAGNQGQSDVMYPGRYESVLAVSALTENGILATFSNRGAEVAVCAPGDAITAFTVGGRVVTLSGTSYAAPHVSGVLALMLSASPGLSPPRAAEWLQTTAGDLGPRGRDDQYGFGMIDAVRAVSAALGR